MINNILGNLTFMAPIGRVVKRNTQKVLVLKYQIIASTAVSEVMETSSSNIIRCLVAVFLPQKSMCAKQLPPNTSSDDEALDCKARRKRN